MNAEPACGDAAPSWQNYPWNREVRSKFLTVYVAYGFFLFLGVLGTVSSVQQHNGFLALLLGVVSALIAFWVGRAAYRHAWLARHNRDRAGLP